MSPPRISDFQSAEPFSAYWTYARDDGRVDVCSTRGIDLIRDAQAALGLAQDGVWSAQLAARLVAEARAMDAAQPGAGWNTLAGTLALDASGGRVNGVDVLFAVWRAYYKARGLRYDALALPSGARLPLFGAAPPGADGQRGFACYAPATDPAPETLTLAQLGQAAAESTLGMRVHPGETAPLPAASAPVPKASGVSGTTLLWLGLAAGAVALGLAAYNARAPKRNPCAGPRCRGGDSEDDGVEEVDLARRDPYYHLKMTYSELHDGLLPDKMKSVVIPPLPDELVELGPMPESRYWKRHLEGGRSKIHVYRHPYFEKASEEEAMRKAPVLAHDKKGNLWIVNQEHITVTDRGIEDR